MSFSASKNVVLTFVRDLLNYFILRSARIYKLYIDLVSVDSDFGLQESKNIAQKRKIKKSVL
jgi:hypothetical protein